MKFLEPLVRTKKRDYTYGQYLDMYAQWKVGGHTYTQPVQTTIPGQKAAAVGGDFMGLLDGGYASNGVIFGLASVRMRVFSEARFQWQRMRGGRPGDMFGTTDLRLLEHPWPGGTTGDLLSAMLLHADFAGNAFVVRNGDRLVLLRPDWVRIVLSDTPYEDEVQYGSISFETVGYEYYHDGVMSKRPVVFQPEQVAHFMPQPDPRAKYRVGMSWLTPVIREIQADGAATGHKLKFFENAATPNLAVSLPKEITPAQFEEFVDAMDEKHKGASNAYKTLYTGGGADVTVIGQNMQQLDFKVTQGAGETRLAQAAGVPPVVAGLSEGLQGSSLNAGNFGQARRQFADTTLSHLWRNAAGSLEVLFPPPGDARLWYDNRDIPFLREDLKDSAEIQQVQAVAIKQLIDAGYEPETVVKAVTGNDYTLLTHTGLFSVQLQPAGVEQAKPEPQLALPPAREEPVPVVHVHNNVDARSFVERGAITTNVDNRTGTDADEVIERTFDMFEQRGLFETPELPAPIVNVPAPLVHVEQPRLRSVRRDVFRGEDGRIDHVIETEIADG